MLKNNPRWLPTERGLQKIFCCHGCMAAPYEFGMDRLCGFTLRNVDENRKPGMIDCRCSLIEAETKEGAFEKIREVFEL